MGADHPHAGRIISTSRPVSLPERKRGLMNELDRGGLFQVPPVLGDADVCIFPSLWENFPFVCLEAMSGAIVGSSAGGMAEMLAEGAGMLVKPGSPARWAEAICQRLLEVGRE
jgi:glycosyltransferase involved in cell wall biosynthesis